MPLANLELSNLRSHVLRRGDLVITRTGRVGTTAIFEDFRLPVLPGAFLIRFRLKREIADPYYLMYLFNSREGQALIASVATGSVQQNLNITSLHNLRFALPSLNEQRMIARTLGSMDNTIEQNRKTNQALAQTASAIFKAWFIDFEPVMAKAAGAKSFPSMPQAVFETLPAEFEQSALGEIPKGWRCGKIEDIADINARTLSVSDDLPVIDYIEISEVSRGDIGTVTRYVRGEEPSRARRRLAHGDSVISTVRPDRGSHFLCLNPSESLVVSTGFAVLSAKDNNWAFLHSALTRSEVGEELGRLADGGAYPAIRPDVIGRLDVVVPDTRQLINAFQGITGAVYELAGSNREESKILATLRDALLPKLLSGELRVGAACEAVGVW